MKLGESADTGGNEKKPKVCVRGKGEERVREQKSEEGAIFECSRERERKKG